MNPSQVKEHLVEIIIEIQKDSGLECPSLSGTTKPQGDVEQFDSLISAVATGELAERVRIEIPDDLDLFYDKKNNCSRSIDDIVKLVCGIQEKNR